jgi:hypothetical protein
MRRLRLGGVAAALLIGLGAAVATIRAGDYYEEDSQQATGLLSGMFNEKPKKQAKSGKNTKNARNAKNGNEVKPPPPVPTAEAGYVESVAAEQQRHMNALIRRMEVCDRLRMIADQSGDEALMIQANELEERANAIYRHQISGLPLPAPSPLSVLADDRQNPNRGPQGAVATAPSPMMNGRGADIIQSVPQPAGSGRMGGR